jgi:hypothetical protein
MSTIQQTYIKCTRKYLYNMVLEKISSIRLLKSRSEKWKICNWLLLKWLDKFVSSGSVCSRDFNRGLELVFPSLQGNSLSVFLLHYVRCGCLGVFFEKFQWGPLHTVLFNFMWVLVNSIVHRSRRFLEFVWFKKDWPTSEGYYHNTRGIQEPLTWTIIWKID